MSWGYRDGRELTDAGSSSGLLVASRHWYLIQCKPRESFRAEQHLQNQGYQCYHPVQRVEKLRRGTPTWLTEPLFPYYLFVALDQVEDNWYPIRSTRGVARLVTFNGKPLPVAESLIEALQQRTRPEQAMPYQCGDRVQITEGCFSHIEAIFKARTGTERVVLLIQLLNQTQEVQVPLAAIRPL